MKKFLFILFIFCVNISLYAQVVTVGGGASITCPAVPTATWTTPPAGVVFSNWSRGSGVTCGSATDGISGSVFNAADAAAGFTANRYFSVTITSMGASFDVTAITWLTAISGGSTGNFAVKYSNDGGAVTDFGTTGTSNTSNSFTGSVSVASGKAIVLYLIPFAATASTRTIRLKNASTFTLSNVVLPIVLSSFNVINNNNNNNNELRFTTASESNNSHFEIERSKDGKNYETISRVEGKGTTQEVSNYNFTDRTPNKGINYYRLKQVDFDGRFEYSKVVSVYVGEKNLDVNVASATNDVVRLNIFTQNEDDAVVSIVDMNGRIILSQKVVLTAKDNQLNLDANLQNGMYVVKITTANGEQVSKMLNIR